MSEDAKLSTGARKKLPGSAFCGPNRSFPVHDCAHYTAALRLLSRYKGPGSKSKIRSCIMRKGKSLGCGAKDDENKLLEEIMESWSEVQIKEAEALINSEEYEQERALLDFLSTELAEYEVADVKVETLMESAASLLDTLRMKRTGSNDSRLEEYKSRSINAVMDALIDEIKAAMDEVVGDN